MTRETRALEVRGDGEERTADGSAGPALPRQVALFGLTLLLLVMCALLARPFLPALTWSIALAVATRRPYRWLQRKVHRPGVAAALGTLLVLVIVVAPVLLLLKRLGQQFYHLVTLVQSGAAQSWVQGMLQQHPKVGGALDRVTSSFNVRGGTEATAGYLAGKLQSVLAGSVRTVTQLAITLYTLFFLMRDGDQAKRMLQSLLPMRRAHSEDLLQRMGEAIEASILGSLTIAAIQGTLGGVIFAILGVPNAVLWAFVMGMLATIPSLGTFLVWAPVAVFLALSGHVVKALVLAGFGMGVIGTIDNVLYPTLVSKRLRMHTVATFFAVLGGVALFGVSGLVLGPLTLVTAVELLRLWSPGILKEGDGRAQ